MKRRLAALIGSVAVALATAVSQTSATAAPTTVTRHSTASTPAATAAPAATAVFNVKTYGATGNGSTNDTPAINSAITAANSAGGGIVEFPSGTYKSANSIHLKSNVTLQLDSGSKVAGSSARTYDAAEPNAFSQYQDYGHSHFHDAMIWGDSLTNIGFTGSGTIDGGGNLITATANPAAGQADKIISLTRCNGLTLSGITLSRGGHFAALINGCTNVTSDHLTISTASDQDGWNIISTTHVTITNVTIASNDDALVFKSDYALGATLPSGHVSVVNAKLSARCCNALMFGSETCGSFTDYQFQGITITGAGKSGLGMVSMDGADITDVHYQDVTMTGVHSPIMEKIGTRLRCGGSPTVGHISNITYDNVTGTGVANTSYSPTLWGASSGNEISDVTFTNVNLTVPGGNGTMSTGVPSNNPTDYNPAGIGTRPAYGWYLHDVDNVHFLASSVRFAATDGRPAVIANGSSDVTFDGLTAQASTSSPYDLGFQTVAGYCVTNSANTVAGALRINAGGSTQSCSSAPIRIEGEAPGNTLAGATRVATCSACSGGHKVGFIGNGAANFLTINGINEPTAGSHNLTFVYLLSGSRTFDISIDGGPDIVENLTGTSFSTPATASITVNLHAGANTIKFHNDTAIAPDIDVITVS